MDRQTFMLLLIRNTIILIAYDIYLPFIYAPSFRFMHYRSSRYANRSGTGAGTDVEVHAKINNNMWFIVQINVILNCNNKKKQQQKKTLEMRRRKKTDITDRQTCLRM